jgi:NRAMP (natural resistance-associated macrophage protein)-like metal ion transporter
MTLEPPVTKQLADTRLRTVLTAHHRGRPRPLRRINRFLRVLGPGLITGAADDDPAGIGTYSQSGAVYGLSQLWLALYLLPLVIGVQEMCGRIGLVTDKGIADVVRTHYSRTLLLGAVALLFVANTINVGADLGIMVASIRLLAPGMPFLPLLVALALGILLLEIFVPYRHYARVLKLLTLSLVAYILTGIIIQPDWGALLARTFVPSIQFSPAFLALVVAVLGTTISPYLFFWQASEEVEELELRHRQPRDIDPSRQGEVLRKQIRWLRIDTVLGLFAGSAGFWFIIITTSSTLHAHGITTIQSADQAAAALQPLVHGFPDAGRLAQLIFTLGIVGTGLLAIPVLAGSAAYGIAETFRWREGLGQTLNHARGFYTVIALATLVGLALNLIGINPIAALVYSAIINGVVAVPLLVLILRVANNREIMGKHTNGLLSNTLGIVTTAFMAVTPLVTVVTLIVH